MNKGMRRTIWGVSAALSVLAVAAAIKFRPLPLPSPLRLVARFSPAAGQSYPILTSGSRGNGDFLFVRFPDAETAVFGYDSWGVGGPLSKPVILKPGAVHHLEIEGPMLTDVVGHITGNSHLRVVYDGHVVLDGDVSCHVRDVEQIFVGWNPIGGTSCGRSFNGSLGREDGRPVRGRWNMESWKMRLLDWWTADLQRVLLFLLLAAGFVFGCEKLIQLGRSGTRIRAARAAHGFRQHIFFFATASVAALVFSYIITDETFNFDYQESFGSFYDYQAVSLLQGRLDVPGQAVEGEAFVVHGKTYGYFGPTPAVMRIPFVVLHLAFGKLSRAFMLLDYAGCLVFACLILRLAVRMLRGEDASPSGWSVVLLVANAGLGSTLLFLSSRAYIYHEAILCGAVFALATCYFSLRHMARPGGKAWILAWICGLLCVNARPTTGLFALSFLGCAAIAAWIRPRFQQGKRVSVRRTVQALAIGASCVAGMASYSVIGYLKYGTWDSLPLKYHVQYNPARLARIGGKNFHLSNLACNVDGYLWGPHFKVRPQFPFFYATSPDINDYPEARMDLIEGIVGLPYAMSGLFFLAVGGSVLAVIGRSRLGWALACAWGAVIPLCVALFTAVAMSQRYTGDLCPFLIVAAAIGLAARENARTGIVARTAIWTLTLWSILATLALTLQYQGEGVWGVPDDAHARYQHLRSGVDRLLNLHPDGPSH